MTADAYLAGTTPLLAAIIDRMTDRQRQIARLALVDGLRQSEIAERLDVSRPTVSVSYARADVRNLARLAGGRPADLGRRGRRGWLACAGGHPHGVPA